jgi:hypothetical protein
MANNFITIGGLAIVLFFMAIIFSGLYFVAQDIVERNPNLDDNSLSVIQDLGVNVNNTYNRDTFSIGTSEITGNSTFIGVDAFTRQYLEDKAEVNQKKTVIDKIITAPDFLMRLIGIEDNTILITFRVIVGGLLGFFIALAVIKAIKGVVD